MSLLSKTSAQILYHLDIDNGLPTNYVYNLLADRQGYLWISTQKGVVRYNGYETKLFNFSNGLHKEDIWRTYEDKKGRIWLSSISRQIGYIYNGNFKTAENTEGRLLYPLDIREYDSGIYFINRSNGKFYTEHNSSIYPGLSLNRSAIWIAKNDSEIIIIHNDSILNARMHFDGGRIHSLALSYIMPDNTGPNHRTSIYTAGKYIVSYAKGSTCLWIKDMEQKTDSVIDLQKTGRIHGTIQRIFVYNDTYFGTRKNLLVTEKELFEIDNNLLLHRIKSFDTLLHNNMEGSSISFYADNKLWNKAISGYANGVYILSRNMNHFVKTGSTKFNVQKYIGRDAMQQNYWWNERDKIITRFDSQNRITSRKENGLNSVLNITPYNKDTSFLTGWTSITMMDNRSMKTHNYLSYFQKVITNNRSAFDETMHAFDAFKGIVVGEKIYALSSGGVCEFTPTNDNNLNAYFFTYERYDDMVYDSLRGMLWLYSNDHIDIFKGRQHLLTIPTRFLKLLKIKTIERILVDNTYGNVFIKDYDRLLIFDYEKHTFHNLFDNYMLNNAHVTIYKNRLVAAGKFGALFCSITGKGETGVPVVYHNVKSMAYNNVVDMHVSDSMLLLKTDKDLYTVLVPADSLLLQKSPVMQQPFRLIVLYNNSYINIEKNDTARILQDNEIIHFDVINPEGYGVPVYEYRIAGINNEWISMAGNSLSLPKLKPGKSYTLQLQVNDAVWRSRPIEMHIYIVPYWWQKPGWQVSFWVSGIIIILLFGVAVARVTRKIVEHNNERRNARLELELKAIYSQINPHFIYNTLNSALLLINNRKIEEAYTHVSKFSKLLRAYVKSSRNKYITLAEEITNIRNYIELQQTRFKNRFDYGIETDESIDTGYERIPSLLLQPFVENAINHGLLNKEGWGKLKIRFKKSGISDVVCTIEDDGIGRMEAKTKNIDRDKEHESYGNAMIKELVDIFNRYETIKIEIKVIDKVAPLTGTIVEILIKREHHEK